MDFKAKTQEKLPVEELHARYTRVTVFYRRIENSGRTNQIRGFPIEHS